MGRVWVTVSAVSKRVCCPTINVQTPNCGVNLKFIQPPVYFRD